EINDRIVFLLSQSKGEILDDEELIETLDRSETTSKTVKKRLQQAEETEKNIDQAREQFRPVAFHGSFLYFVLASLSHLDPMYEFSLAFFKNLFNNCFETTPRGENLQQRLQLLLNSITSSLYSKVCQGLLEKHKLPFAFYIITSI